MITTLDEAKESLDNYDLQHGELLKDFHSKLSVFQHLEDEAQSWIWKIAHYILLSPYYQEKIRDIYKSGGSKYDLKKTETCPCRPRIYKESVGFYWEYEDSDGHDCEHSWEIPRKYFEDFELFKQEEKTYLAARLTEEAEKENKKKENQLAAERAEFERLKAKFEGGAN